MQDRFKFRLWDDDNNEFDYIDLAGDTQDLIEILHIYSNYFSDTWLQNNPKLIQQCAGLKDKNGKLIYEGDILQQSDGIIDQVYWNNGCYLHNGTAITNYDPMYQGDWWAKEVKTYEIIGNIYENAELLEV